MASIILRREFILGAASTALFPIILASSKAYAQNYSTISIASYSLPLDAGNLNLEKIANSLRENKTVKEVLGTEMDYIPDFLKLIQSTRQDITGKTIQREMEEHLGMSGQILVNIVEGFEKKVRAWRENQNVFVDSSFSASDFLILANHELVHASFGNGELLAYGHTHRDIAYITAKYPQILNLEACPLMDLAYDYARHLLDNQIKNNRDGARQIEAYLLFLDNFNKGKSDGQQQPGKSPRNSLDADRKSVV